MAMSMRACFILGLEYVERDKGTQRSSYFITEQAKEALPMLRAALEPLIRYGSNQIGLLVQSGKLLMSQASTLADEFGKISLQSAARFFRIWLEYSSRL